MNALTPISPSGLGLVPRNMGEAMQLAEMMARGKMMPEHLRNAGDALMVVEQAMRWNMSPFAVAQATFNIKGKLLFAGTIVHAAVENSSAIDGLIDYQFSGEGPTRKVTVIARRRGEAEPRTVEVALKDARTTNDIWNKQPDQQLCYHGARVWARRWTPGVMLGVYTPEEWRDLPADNFTGTTLDARPEPTPEPQLDIEELGQRATDAADLGTATYQAFWAALSKTERAAILPHHERLKAIARDVDAHAAADEPVDEPTDA